MLALGSVKTAVTDSVKSGRVPFDMHGFLTGVVLADLSLSGVFQRGRVWGASALLFPQVNLGVEFFLQPEAGAASLLTLLAIRPRLPLCSCPLPGVVVGV